MPPTVRLTEGAIEMLNIQQELDKELKPLLQVLDHRTVSQSNSGGERYRLILSDGVHKQQAMLASQLNNLIRSQELQNGSIIQLTEYTCSDVQNRKIIIILGLDVILLQCEPIGVPVMYQRRTDDNAAPVTRSSPSVHPINQHGIVGSGVQSLTAGSVVSGSSPRANFSGVNHMVPLQVDHSTVSYTSSGSFTGNPDSGRSNSTTAAPMYAKAGIGIGTSRVAVNSYPRPPQSSHPQPLPIFSNREPIRKNEAPQRIIPIAALHPYQGNWTIKARVTTKAELRHYKNPRGDGKVFSFDLLDADGGEIRVTCFNAVADQFYHQIERGKVYMISKGNLKPAQKAYNNLCSDLEITLISTSTVQPCFDDDKSIPQQQFHFCKISEIEGMDNNKVVDVIGVVTSISTCSTIMRKDGTETQRQNLQMKDSSGKSVEITLWGNFCNAEGQTLKSMCDSGIFPVLAIKSGRVSDFNGKTLGTLSTSQLLIDPDFPDARNLKSWFDNDGKNIPSVSISRETTVTGKEVQKTISQIKDESLGTSDKPDWITVCATVTHVKRENFCYTACPLRNGDRQCSKKVTNNGDGKYRCDRCDQTIDECDYRYILQVQIQDHTGNTWVNAFQDAGSEIMGVSAKELYLKKYEEQDDESVEEIMRNVLFSNFIFKLKVKEENFNDEIRVKSTVVKAERVNFSEGTRYMLDLVGKLKNEELGSLLGKTENVIPSSGLNAAGLGTTNREPASLITNYGAGTINVSRDSRVHLNQGTSHGNQYGGSRLASTSSTGMYSSCNSCGATGHTSANCPSVVNIQSQSFGGGYGRVHPGASAGGASSISNAPPAYGSVNVTPYRYGQGPRQQVGGF